MDRQILRDWALRFNAEGPDGLIDRQAPGPTPKLTPEQLAAVVRLVEDGQILAIHGVVRWRLIDLTGWIHDEYGVSLDPADWAGSSRRSATDACPPGPDTTPRTRRPWRPSSGIFPVRVQEIRERLPRRTRLEVWFQDEARIGQKNKLTRRWARRGTRPSAPKDQRTQSAYLFGTICPQKGTAAGLVMPYCDTQAKKCPSGRDQRPGRARPSRDPAARPSLVAHLPGPRDAARHHPPAAAGQGPGAQSGREPLAVPARQPPLQPHLQGLHGHRRSLLRRLEHHCRPALAHHVHRPQRLGPGVLISAGWYYAWPARRPPVARGSPRRRPDERCRRGRPAGHGRHRRRTSRRRRAPGAGLAAGRQRLERRLGEAGIGVHPLAAYPPTGDAWRPPARPSRSPQPCSAPRPAVRAD